MTGRMSLARAFATVGSFTLMSRLLGFVRDVLMARYLGAGLAADVFFVAFKLPNFFRRLFAEGAFSAAFVPMFSRALGQRAGADARLVAKAFAEDALSVLLLALLVLTALMEALMPLAMIALAPGFAENPEKFDAAVALTRLSFPYLMLISLASLFAGILNACGRYAAAAGAPILLNLCLIAAMLLFRHSPLETARALAIAVSIAGVAQLLLLMFAAGRAGFRLGLPRPRLTPAVRRLLSVMMPVAVGAGMAQINLMIDIVLASLLPEGSLSWLFYADRLSQLPLGVIGIAIGTVLLPGLSRRLATGERSAANADHNRAIEYALLLTLPAAAGLIAIGHPIVTALFGHGAFDAEDSTRTAAALMAFAAGLPAFVLVKTLIPGFYAREDMKRPVHYALAALIVNLVLNLLLMGPLGHVGLALATTIAACANAALLWRNLVRHHGFRADDRLRHAARAILGASLLLGIGLHYGDRFLEGLPAVLRIALLIPAGLLSYALLASLMGGLRISELRRRRA